MQIIELTGVPGSGKSTFKAKLFRELEGKGVSYVLGNHIQVGLLSTIFIFLVHILARPRLCVFVLRVVLLRIKLLLFKDACISVFWFARTIAQYKYAQSRQVEYVVFDEGYLHRLYTLSIFHPAYNMKKYFKQYLSNPLNSDLVLLFTVDEEESFRRLTLRSFPSRWKKFTELEKKKLLQLTFEVSDFYLGDTHSSITSDIITNPSTTTIL